MGRNEEVTMQSVFRKAALVSAAFVVFFGGSARASTIEVKVPFAFVVHGQTLPAGSYRLERDPMDPSVVVIRGEKGNTTSVMAVTMPVGGHDPAGDKPALTFKRNASEYQLVDIWNGPDQGREIAGS